MISFGGEGERRGYSWERWTPPATARGLYRLEQGLWKAPLTGVARRRVSEKGEQRDLVKKENDGIWVVAKDDRDKRPATN